jgi:hypothetical protein
LRRVSGDSIPIDVDATPIMGPVKIASADPVFRAARR